MSLERLPDDILIDIFGLLEVSDLLSTRQTSHRFSSLSRLKHVWYLVFIRQLVTCNLPVPGRHPNLYSITSSDLERRTIRAQRLDTRWCQCSLNVEPPLSLSPRRTFTIVEREGPVQQLVLFPGGHRAVTVHTDKVISWAIDETDGALAQLGHWRMPCNGCRAVLDTSSGWETVIAVGPTKQSDFPTTILALTDNQTDNAFSVLGKIPTAGNIISLHGDNISFEVQMDGMHLGVLMKLWTAPETSSQTGALLLQLNEHCGEFLGMHYYADHVVVVWTHAVGMYSAPTVPSDELCCYMPSTVFSLGEIIEAPISFTSCQPRRFPSHESTSSYFDTTTHPSSKLNSLPSPLTILARSINPRSTLSQIVISPVQRSSTHSTAADINSPLSTPPPHPEIQFRLIRSSPTGITTLPSKKSIALNLGSSGRGIRIEEDGSLYRCVPRRVLSAYGVVDSTVDFHPNKKICDVPVRSRDALAGVHGDAEMPTVAGVEVNSLVGFDDSLGRLVVCDGNFINVLDFS